MNLLLYTPVLIWWDEGQRFLELPMTFRHATRVASLRPVERGGHLRSAAAPAPALRRASSTLVRNSGSASRHNSTTRR